MQDRACGDEQIQDNFSKTGGRICEALPPGRPFQGGQRLALCEMEKVNLRSHRVTSSESICSRTLSFQVTEKPKTKAAVGKHFANCPVLLSAAHVFSYTITALV